MVQKITGEAPFQVLATNFSISPSQEDYTLQISADGTNYSDLFTVSAGQTKMVTNVANGSYYRLKNNASEVSINWRTQCNDGQGGGGGGVGPQGPMGPQGPQGPAGADGVNGLNGEDGAQGPQGPAGANGNDGADGAQGPQGPAGADGTNGADGAQGPQGPAGQDGIEQAPTVLKSVSALPESAETGDVVALAEHTEGLPYGITFEEKDDLGENQDLSGGRFVIPKNFGYGELSQGDLVFIGKVGPEGGSLYDMNIEYLDGYGSYFIYEDPNDPLLSINMDDRGDNLGNYDYLTEIVFFLDADENNYILDIYPYAENPNVTAVAFSDIPEGSEEIGVYQYDGTNWSAIGGGEGGSDVVHLDSLSGTGAENTLYECDEMLWVWSNSAGTVAEWTDSLATLGNSKGYGLIFSHIPEGQVILEFRNGNGTWRKIKMINDVLTLTEDDNTVVTSCTIGNKVQFNTSSYNFYWVKVIYKKHWIGFEVSSSVSFQNVWNGTVQGGHFVITDHSNHPWSDINTDYGIPVWDDKGWVIHKQHNTNLRTVKVNTTGWQATTFLMSDGQNYFPDSIYVPTVGGTAGQILQSNGTETAPTWTNWIKVVKITSAAYDALVQAGTTDPNTLYAIVD